VDGAGRRIKKQPGAALKMDGSGQKEVFGRNKKLKRVTVLVTDGKGDGRRMLIFGTFSVNVLSFEPRLSL
jgi:hypothetical protein